MYTMAFRPMPRQDVMIKGAPGAIFEERVEVFTGEVTIVIFCDDMGRVLRAAEGLQPANSLASSDALLPQPAEGAIEGRLRC